MKKFVYGFFAFFALVLVTGCGDKEKTVACKLSSNDKLNGYALESTYTIYAKGSTVEKVVTKEEVTSDNDEVLEFTEENLKETYKKADQAYGGYKYNVEKKDNKVTSDVTIDYNKMNLEQYAKDMPALKNYMKKGKLSVDGAIAIYEAMGATCDK